MSALQHIEYCSDLDRDDFLHLCNDHDAVRSSWKLLHASIFSLALAVVIMTIGLLAATRGVCSVRVFDIYLHDFLLLCIHVSVMLCCAQKASVSLLCGFKAAFHAFQVVVNSLLVVLLPITCAVVLCWTLSACTYCTSMCNCCCDLAPCMVQLSIQFSQTFEGISGHGSKTRTAALYKYDHKKLCIDTMDIYDVQYTAAYQLPTYSSYVCMLSLAVTHKQETCHGCALTLTGVWRFFVSALVRRDC